jgi:uncharacterized protein
MKTKNAAALLCAWTVALNTWAAPQAPASTQAQVDAAVLAYESGRLGQAQQAFVALARQQVPAAQYNLAVMHLRKELPGASPREAERLLTQAARAGFLTAQFMLAQALETGQFGRKNLAKAHQWYELAAVGGSVPAQVAMGTAYYLGRGKNKDLPKAAQWFREGAKGGDVGAMYLLAAMYEHGDGIDADLRLARYWYGVAATQGDEAAPAKVKELDAKAAQAKPGT